MKQASEENLGKLTTEQQNPASDELDLKSALELAQIINAEDAKVAKAVEQALPQVAQAIDLIADALRQGGRLIYVGAGTSGRIAALDASECPPLSTLIQRLCSFSSPAARRLWWALRRPLKIRPSSARKRWPRENRVRKMLWSASPPADVAAVASLLAGFPRQPHPQVRHRQTAHGPQLSTHNGLGRLCPPQGDRRTGLRQMSTLQNAKHLLSRGLDQARARNRCCWPLATTSQLHGVVGVVGLPPSPPPDPGRRMPHPRSTRHLHHHASPPSPTGVRSTPTINVRSGNTDPAPRGSRLCSVEPGYTGGARCATRRRYGRCSSS